MGHAAQFIPMMTVPKMQMLTAFKNSLSLLSAFQDRVAPVRRPRTLDGVGAHRIVLIITAHRCLSVLLKLYTDQTQKMTTHLGALFTVTRKLALDPHSQNWNHMQRG